MAYPFSPAKPGGYGPTDVPTHTELNQIDENAAAGADGDAYTDVAMAANFPHVATAAISPQAWLYNPVLDRWFAFQGTTPSGFSTKHPLLVHTALTIPAAQGLLLGAGDQAAVDPATGMMVICGVPQSSSQLRYRSSTDGVTWSSRTSAYAASTAGPTGLIWCAAPINRFISGDNTGRVESSPDGITWSTVTTPGAAQITGFAFSPTLPMVISWGPSTSYNTSSTGASGSWTTRTAPVTVGSIWWSANRGLFYLSEASGSCRIYSSPNGITWTLVATPQKAVSARRWFEFGRLVGYVASSGEVLASVDGATWRVVAEPVSGIAWAGVDEQHRQLVVSVSTTCRASWRLGF